LNRFVLYIDPGLGARRRDDGVVLQRNEEKFQVHDKDSFLPPGYVRL